MGNSHFLSEHTSSLENTVLLAALRKLDCFLCFACNAQQNPAAQRAASSYEYQARSVERFSQKTAVPQHDVQKCSKRAVFCRQLAAAISGGTQPHLKVFRRPTGRYGTNCHSMQAKKAFQPEIRPKLTVKKHTNSTLKIPEQGTVRSTSKSAV